MHLLKVPFSCYSASQQREPKSVWKSLFPQLGILISYVIAKKRKVWVSVVYLDTMRSHKKAQKRFGITMLEKAWIAWELWSEDPLFLYLLVMIASIKPLQPFPYAQGWTYPYICISISASWEWSIPFYAFNCPQHQRKYSGSTLWGKHSIYV